MTAGELIPVRVGRVSMLVSRRAVAVDVAAVVLIAALALWGLTRGAQGLGLGDVLDVVLGRADRITTTVIVDWRLPRIVAAVVLGAALGFSGAVFQSLTRNPLGSPDVIGFTHGSLTGVIAVIFLGGTGFAAVSAGALAGGLGAALLVYLLAFRDGVQGFRLIIVGIAVGAFLTALNGWFMVTADLDDAYAAAVWGAGSVATVDWRAVASAAAVLVLVALCAPVAQRWMRQMELSDDAAAATGVPVERVRLALVVLGVAAIAAVTAVSGPIGFVALAAPQIARRLTGRGATVDLVGSAIVGALVLVAADLVAQHVIPGVSLPVGAVTVCLGGIYLVVLLAVESRR
ncbi:iron chelate uptake ABC transporter family permease subunit [Tsukamurella sp. M9C]|uniref:FecCD family ABC transporter permease n=1 Tax=Tsukamurella sp. M9C TaxID=2877520 RepID=UPI001CCEC798|nr:iron chelate uptake ABC transporter family permease subunit [Tsukamurella sp. M9C]MCA0157295.1 iron chelate uptake ABC transporter family permease subunit [Tsukamurella sp. M9C]